jgi:polysaccharide export outer membrane protein
MTTLSLLLVAITAVGAEGLNVAQATPVEDAASLQTMAPQIHEDYVIGGGDVLSVSVFGETDLTGIFEVTLEGNIDFPLVGQLLVRGLTTGGVDEALTRLLNENFLVNPQVSIRLDEYGSQPVQVLGAVRKPGVFHLTGPTTVIDMLAETGGVTQEAGVEVHVQRAGGLDPIVIPLDGLREFGTGNLLLGVGDVVYVPLRRFVYVAGEVAKPGTINFREGLTVTQALTEAGGPSRTARLRDAYVLRDGQQIPINLRRINQGRDEDISLRPDDQIFLRESAF